MKEKDMMTDTQVRAKSSPRTDRLALWGGILFSLVFTGIIWWAGQRLASVPHLPDTGPSWYYWKLPAPTLWSRVIAWGFYVLHQVTLWGLIYYAQTRVRRYKAGLHPVNVAALAANAFFVALHFVQTHLWYDGLAQDVSIWSSQGSVILMLVMILLMENRRRGLFFGKKVPLPQQAMQFVRRYHGYVFAWATVYTFWYHPMEPTSGHLIGFLYMFLLLLQGSLFYTRVHVNRWWMLVQEGTVLLHGTLVAVMQGNNLWPMFAFGFGGLLVITQMHGLGLSARVRGVILALYVGAALLVYSQRGWVQLNEIVRIPIIEYVAVFVLAWLIGGALWLARRLAGTRGEDRAGDAALAGQAES
jgi:hypothetical protein